MTYFKSMLDLLKGTPDSRQISDLKHLQTHCLINVLILGLIYGTSAIFLSKPILAQGGHVLETPMMIKILMAGASIAFLMHAGASLFFWVFFKAVGGALPFNMIYFKIRQASISLWPLAPFLASFQAGLRHPILTVATLFFSGYALLINYRQILAITKLTGFKLSIAFIIAFIYISCFLYLWV